MEGDYLLRITQKSAFAWLGLGGLGSSFAGVVVFLRLMESTSESLSELLCLSLGDLEGSSSLGSGLSLGDLVVVVGEGERGEDMSDGDFLGASSSSSSLLIPSDRVEPTN